MNIESVWQFIGAKDEASENIAAGYEVNLDWVSGYKHALSEMREFIGEDAAVEPSETEPAAQAPPVTIDLLNDAQFLELTHRALNLCAASEAVLYCLPKDDAAALRDAADYFRQWFARQEA
jgi:hypothetical protein